MSEARTPEERQKYTSHLKRLAKIIQSRIYDDIKRAQFIDAFPTLGEGELLQVLRGNLENLGNSVDVVTHPGGLEDIIRDLRELEHTLHTIRYEAERDNNKYYDIELADYLVMESKRRPESTMPPLPPWQDMQLPEVAGIGGKRKKTRKRGRKPKKKTRGRK